jgi:transposase
MKEAEVVALQRENERLKKFVSNLEGQLAWLRKKVSGSMSEKHLPLNPNELQLNLFPERLSDEEKSRLQAKVTSEQKNIERMIRTKEKPSRKPLNTSTLPIKEEHVYPKNMDTDDYKVLAPEISDSIERILAKVYIRKIIRHKYVLRSDLQIMVPERKTFEISPMPLAPIDKLLPVLPYLQISYLTSSCIIFPFTE